MAFFRLAIPSLHQLLRPALRLLENLRFPRGLRGLCRDDLSLVVLGRRAVFWPEKLAYGLRKSAALTIGLAALWPITASFTLLPAAIIPFSFRKM